MFTLQSQYICLKFHIRDRVVEAKAQSLLALGYCQSETITYARFSQKQHIPWDNIERAISDYVCPWFKYRSGGARWPIRPWLWSLAHFVVLLYIHMHGIGVPETSVCRIYIDSVVTMAARKRDRCFSGCFPWKDELLQGASSIVGTAYSSQFESPSGAGRPAATSLRYNRIVVDRATRHPAR